jgi:hypothetical protein
MKHAEFRIIQGDKQWSELRVQALACLSQTSLSIFWFLGYNKSYRTSLKDQKEGDI